MSDEQTTRPGGDKAPGDAWREVGKQFETLGSTLAEAVRKSWYTEENRKRLQEMQGGLEKMASEVSQAIRDSASSPQAEQAKGQVRRTAESMRTAGEQTIQEIRPHLLATLRQLNDELEKLVKRMEADRPAGDKPNEPPSAER